VTVTLDKNAQCRASLDYANEIRTHRAELKQEIAAGTASAREVLMGEDEWVRTMRLYDVLRAVPGLGKVKVGWALSSLRISSTAKLYQVRPQRREKLLLFLEARYPAVRGRL
jgi:hypothetical protein